MLHAAGVETVRPWQHCAVAALRSGSTAVCGTTRVALMARRLRALHSAPCFGFDCKHAPHWQGSLLIRVKVRSRLAAALLHPRCHLSDTSTATRDPKDIVIAGVLLGYTLCVWSAPRPAVANISVARRVGLMTRLTSSSCPWAFCMHKRFLDSHQCSSILCKVHRQDKEKLKSTQHVAQQMPLSFQQASAAAYSTDMQAITNSQSSPTQVASHSQSCGQVQVRLRG
jgi:hypothetical protein